MNATTRTKFAALAITLVALIPSATWAQQKHGGEKMANAPGMKMDMSMMMKSPHHKLMMAYIESMSGFAIALRDQATKPRALDVDVARATVAELRHNLDASEAMHEKHMQSMSAEMQSKMKIMMDKMGKNHAMPTDMVSALETDLQADKPNAVKVRVHANALIKHLGMMSKMTAGGAGKKKPTTVKDDAKMDMKKM